MHIGNPISFADLFVYLTWLLGIVIKVGIVAIAVYVVFSGFKFIKAQGNEKELSVAKEAAVGAIIGAAIILGGFAIASLLRGTVEQVGPVP
ncbi:hypothetical protein L0Y69_02800 [bacterium]|nr:hypothetical protein [bacterium]